MKTFTISADDLNSWFANRSPDCLNDPQWGYGDLRQCEGSFFQQHARSAWGLRQVGYPIDRDGFRFEIASEDTFFGNGAAAGMKNYGVIEEA